MSKEAARFTLNKVDVETFSDEVVRGLSQAERRISPKFFYDDHGSVLFEQICLQPEYYLPRVEMEILRHHALEIARLAGPDAALVEFGSGASRKVRLLLDALRPAAYFGVDISKDFLRQATRRLAQDYPWLEVHAVCADLCRPLQLISLNRHEHRLAFYPGSSIGNFEPLQAQQLLRDWRPLLGPDGALLIGVDTKKQTVVLNAAYNDAAGVTARFNLNLLRRMCRELGAEIDVDGFQHEALYNEEHGRLEMYLVSKCRQQLRVGGRVFQFEAGDRIHTENSYKYTPQEFASLANVAGYTVVRTWTDLEEQFSVHYLRVNDIHPFEPVARPIYGEINSSSVEI